MHLIQFRSEIGPNERLVRVWAAIGTEGPDHRARRVEFDDVKDIETGETVEPEWFDRHIGELVKAAFSARKRRALRTPSREQHSRHARSIR